MIFEPKAGQSLIIDHIVQHDRSLIFADMGFGKTGATIFAIMKIKVFPVVIIAPPLVAKETWPSEIEKWDNINLKCICLNGTKEQIHKKIKENAHIYTIDFESAHHILGYKIPFMVVDESSRLKGFRTRQGSKRAKNIYKMARKSSRFVGLTGTPIPNGYVDLWGQMFFVDHGLALGSSFRSYTNMFFTAKQVGKSQFAKKYILNYAQDKVIEHKIKDKVLTIRAQDYFDIDKPIFKNLAVKLNSKAHDEYVRMINQLWSEIEGVEILAKNAAVKSSKLLQITSGAIYDDDKNYHVLHDLKLDKLESIINEVNQPIIVVYHFKHEVERIRKRFKFAKVLSEDSNLIKEWNTGSVKLLLLHSQSAGHGLNLQYGGNVMVFFTCWWNLEEHQQVIERIGPMRQKQAGFNRPVYIYRIVCDETIDLDVISRLEGKATIQDSFKKALAKYATKGVVQ